MAAYNSRGVPVWVSAVMIVIFLWSFLHLNINTPQTTSDPKPEAILPIPKKGSALEKEPLRIYVPPTVSTHNFHNEIPGLHHVADSQPASYPTVDEAGNEIIPPSTDPSTSEPKCPIQPFDISKCPSVEYLADHTSAKDCPICPPSNPNPNSNAYPNLPATPRPPNQSNPPNGLISSVDIPHDRPLILYAYSESDFGRTNLAFFVNHGLHEAADFIFILNGETDVDQTVLPIGRHNVRIMKRENTCFDLGAHAEVLQSMDDPKVAGGGRKLKDRYKRFILMNASIRGPFVPHWSRECWSDAYLGRLNNKVKLVGSSLNCHGGDSPHVQSMIWATDSVGLPIILQPEGIGECFESLSAAMGGEIRTTPHLRSKGYEVDVMLSIFQTERDYKYVDCKHSDDFLFQGAYFGFNVHPYETLFVKSHRGIDDDMLEKLTTWHDLSGYSSYDVCKG